MAWLAINKSGREYIFQSKPVRIGDVWTSYRSHNIELPKQTIQRITGKKMTWDSEPFELSDRTMTNKFYVKVCNLCGCDVSDLKKHTRKQEIVWARQIIMAYSKIVLKMSLKAAADEFGLNHCSALHSIKKVQEFYLDRQYREHFAEVFEEFPELLQYKIGEERA